MQKSKTGHINHFQMENFNITIGAFWHGAWPAGKVEPNRMLYDCELVFFSEGRCRVICETQTFFCGRGMCVISPPGREHCTMADTACHRWCIHFDWYGDCRTYAEKRPFYISPGRGQFFDRAYAVRENPALELPCCFQLNGEEAAEITALFRRFFALPREGLGNMLRKRGLFMQILGLVLASTGSVSREKQGSPVFFRGKRLLDMYFSEPETEIRQVAEELKITPNHLNKLFRRYLGTTPQLYLQNRRLQHAETLLKETEKSIKEIALLSGFSDAAYFIRCFRKKNDITPGRFRLLDLKNT